MTEDEKVKIENEFEECEDRYRIAAKGSRDRKTGCQDVLQAMLDRPEKIWWWSWEFIGQVNSKGNFLSHRSPARASDLALHSPDLVEDRRISRFKVYRLKRENLAKVEEFLK